MQMANQDRKHTPASSRKKLDLDRSRNNTRRDKAQEYVPQTDRPVDLMCIELVSEGVWRRDGTR